MQEKIQNALKAIDELHEEIRNNDQNYALTFGLSVQDNGRIAKAFQCKGNKELIFESIEQLADLANAIE